MRKSNTQNIGNLVSDFIKALNLDSKLKEVEVIKAWEKMVGKRIMKATSDIYIVNNVLYVLVNSSIVRQELSMVKEGLLEKLRTDFGEEVLIKIIIK